MLEWRGGEGMERAAVGDKRSERVGVYVYGLLRGWVIYT